MGLRVTQDPAQGRLVLTHSTYVEGLIPILQKLVTYPGIKTVTPGVISQAKSKSPQLKLRVSVAIRGGYKLVARRGSSVQEVFVITALDQPEIQALIEQLLGLR